MQLNPANYSARGPPILAEADRRLLDLADWEFLRSVFLEMRALHEEEPRFDLAKIEFADPAGIVDNKRASERESWRRVLGKRLHGFFVFNLENRRAAVLRRGSWLLESNKWREEVGEDGARRFS